MPEIDGPDEHWKKTVLGFIEQRGWDVVRLQEIYAEMENHPLVTPYHMQPWRPGLQPRYQCWIRRYLTDLVREGNIRRVSRGKYSLLQQQA
ncbi:hypothetical protein EPO44_08935 [bacterium]|nr:MAG: hypothetical protein EPO44_08935 [bacterium]